MTDSPDGAIYPGRHGSEIVGPAVQAATLAEAFNDLELHVTFRGPDDAGARLYSRATMALLGIQFPVLCMPASAEAGWYADPKGVEHVQRYGGELPGDNVGRRTSFGIVRPGAGS